MILFATPMYGGQCTEPFFHSVMRTLDAMREAGIPCEWLSERNESLVHRARMEMTATFLRESAFTHLFWWDADIEGKPDDVAKLWNMNADIAVGVYAMKKPDKQWFAAWKDGELVKDLDQFKGPIEVDYAGTGFMLISRKAIEAVMAHLRAKFIECNAIIAKVRPLLTESQLDLATEMVQRMSFSWDGANGPCPAIFQTPIYQQGLESEDYHFCRLAREAGLKVMMDPSVRLKHWGQYAFGA